MYLQTHMKYNIIVIKEGTMNLIGSWETWQKLKGEEKRAKNM